MVQFKPEEIAAIVKDFDEPGSLAPTGLFLGGTKYMVIQGEPGAVIRGKKVIYYGSVFLQNYISHVIIKSLQHDIKYEPPIQLKNTLQNEKKKANRHRVPVIFVWFR